MVNIFKNDTAKIPQKADDNIVRVDMEQLDIGGRKSHLPRQEKSDKLTVTHVPNKS
jgi:hypothetical protein